MTAATDSTYISQPGSPLRVFEKYGLPGLVIAVLLWFVWFNLTKMTDVVEKNSSVITEFKGSMDNMTDALEDNTSAFQSFREERRQSRNRDDR